MTTKVSILNHHVQTTDVTVANGGTTSSAVDLESKTLCGIEFDAGVEGTTLQFTVAATSTGTFKQMINTAGAAIQYTIAASKYLVIDPSVFAGVRYVKFVLASQTGDTTLTLHYRGV